MDQALMYVDWREVKRFDLTPEEVEECRRDDEAFAARRVSGRINETVLTTGPGFAELTIEFQPIATESCEDCVTEGLASPALATHEDHRANRVCPRLPHAFALRRDAAAGS